jgi:hypothetical protein
VAWGQISNVWGWLDLAQAESFNRNSLCHEPAENFCERVSQHGPERLQHRDQRVSPAFSQPILQHADPVFTGLPAMLQTYRV